jgi:transposase
MAVAASHSLVILLKQQSDLSGGLATMKTRQRKNELVKGVLVVGVDIGKLRHHSVLRAPTGLVVKTIAFENDRAGFERLRQEVDYWCNRMRLRGAVLGMEPTGHYWQPLAYWWEENRGQVVLVNPMHTNRAKELEDNSPLKSDPKDAQVIAGLVAEGKFLECHLPRGVFATLRNLVMDRTRCRKRETQMVNQLHQLVDRIFPELDRSFSSYKVKSYRELLRWNADPEVVAQMGVEELGEMLSKWSHGNLGKDRAARIIESARQSVGIREGKEVVNAQIKRVIKQLEVAGQEREELEAEIEKCLKETPGAALLMSVPDLGAMTVAGILAHTGDLTNYDHPDQVIKLAGLNLYKISSGQHKGRVRITKRGQAHFRKILYMAALRSSRQRGSLGHYYGALTERGVAPTAALVAVMRKLLRLSWFLVKKSESFDVEKLMPKRLKAA